jgi:hypothetical protein
MKPINHFFGSVLLKSIVKHKRHTQRARRERREQREERAERAESRESRAREVQMAERMTGGKDDTISLNDSGQNREFMSLIEMFINNLTINTSDFHLLAVASAIDKIPQKNHLLQRGRRPGGTVPVV